MKIHPKVITAIFVCSLLSAILYQPPLNAQIHDSRIVKTTDFMRSLVITKFVSILEDEGGRMSIDDVMSPETADRFQPCGKDSLNLAYKKSVYWVKFVLSNQTDNDHKLILEYSFDQSGKKIDLFLINRKQMVGHLTNDRESESFSEAIRHRFVTFPLIMKKNETVTLYSRIENRAYLDFQLKLHAEDSFKYTFKSDYLFFGLIFGVIFILFVYNLALFFSFRDNSYLYFVALLVAFLCWHFVQEGVLFEFFPILNPLGAALYFSSNLVMGITLLLFSRSFLKLPEHSPRIDKYTVVMMTLLGLNTLLCLVFDAAVFIISRNLLSALAGLSVMVIGPLIYIKGYRPARYFVLATFLAMIPPLLQILAVVEIFGIDVKTSFGTAIGTIFMVSMFSLGLMSRVNATRREKEVAQEQIIEVLTSTEKLKDEFLANTSHELRTPLNGIIGIADAMVGGAAGKLAKPVEENLRLIILSGKRLANLVNDILDFSKLKNRELRLDQKPVNIRQIVNLVIPFCQPLVKGRSIRIQNTISEDTPAVLGDEDRLQQIMYNIIGNSLKFTEEGEVTVSAQSEADEVKIAVADTGIGIPTDQLDVIFEEFVQVDASVNRQFEGAGIGLPITKQLVELHGGSIWIESELGRGTRVTFSIPIARGISIPHEPEVENDQLFRMPFMPEEEIPLPELSEDAYQDGSIVLVVDDDPVNLAVIVNQLAISQFRVLTATGGREALEIVRGKRPPDLVLLDLMMPDMTGFEVMAEIRKTYSILDLPIIVVSARNRVIDFMQAIEAGANDYLSKPVSTQELMTRLKLHDDFQKQNSELAQYRQHLESMVKARTAELNRSLEKGEEARRLAEQANSAKTEFLSNISHELRSPMQGILGFSRLGTSKVMDLSREKLETYFKLITGSGERLLRLLNNLLDLSKMEAGKIDYAFEVHPISDLVRSVVDECYSLLVDKELSIEINEPGLEGNAEMDANRIAQVLHNLLANAIKFSPNKGAIRINSKEENHFMVLSVIDNGIGISKNELEKVFNRFEQGSRSETGAGGTGLGLSICQEIIEGHNGQIWADQNPEGGAIFTFSIPIKQPARPVTQPVALPENSP